MTNEEIIQCLFNRLSIQQTDNDYLLLKEAALYRINTEYTSLNGPELPSQIISFFIDNTRLNDLYHTAIEQAERRMIVINLSLGVQPPFTPLKNLAYYLERMAVIMFASKCYFFPEQEIDRLGIKDTALVKEIIESCPLIEKSGSNYSFKSLNLVKYLWARAVKQELGSQSTEQLCTLGDDGKFFYPMPTSEQKPWDLPTSQQKSNAIKQTPNNHTATSQPDTISRTKFNQILNAYQSQSILSYLNTFWIFSWIPPTRSQTMNRLNNLLTTINKDKVTYAEIEQALTLGDHHVHRLGLFKNGTQSEKSNSGTDEVVLQLHEAFRRQSI